MYAKIKPYFNSFRGLGIILLFILLTFTGQKIALADYFQTDDTVLNPSYTNGFTVADLGLVGTSTMSTTTFKIYGYDHGYGYAQTGIALQCYNDSGYSSYNAGCSTDTGFSSTYLIGEQTLTYNFGGFTTTNGKYYRLVYNRNNIYIGGSTNPEVHFYGDSSYNAYFYLYSSTGGTPAPETSRFTSISISTSTQTVNVQGYWNVPTATSSLQQVEFYQNSLLLGKENQQFVNATTTGAFNLTFTYLKFPVVSGTSTVPITSLDFYANLYEINNDYYNPFGEQNPLFSTLLDSTSTSLYASGSISSSTDVFFISTSTRDVVLYPVYDCDILHLGGCIINAGYYLFAPTQNAVDNYNTLRETMKRKAPFAYFYTVNDNLKNINASSTKAFNLTIPTHLRTYIFNPFDIGLSSILWFFFIINLYKRIKQLQI